MSEHKSFDVTLINKNSIESRNQEMLNDIMELIPNPIYYKNEKGVFTYCNNAFLNYLGLKKSGIIGHSVFETSLSELAVDYDTQDRKLMMTKSSQIFKSKVKYNDGTMHDVLLNKVVNIDDKGNVKGIVGNMTDITELTNYQQKVDRLLKLKQAMLEISKIIIEKNDIIEICNLVLEKVSITMEKADIGCVMVLDDQDKLKIIASKGYDVEQCKKFNLKLRDTFHFIINNGIVNKPIIINNIQNFDWKDYTDYWKRSRSESEKIVLVDKSENLDWNNYSKELENAEMIKVESSISTPILFNNQLFGFINIDSTKNYAFDDSDLEVMEYIKNQIEVGISKYKLYEQMIYLSRYDKLTNIYNRGYFEQLLDISIKTASNTNKYFYLVMFDLNSLKIINDTYGHLGGDEVIKKFALHLSNIISNDDYIGRLGGDEFAAIIFNIEEEELVDKLEILNREFLNKPIKLDEYIIYGSFSYGISKFPEEGTGYNQLFKKADKKMYEYKKKIKKYCR